MKRERVEDLGAIRVMIRNLLDNEAFYILSSVGCRKKDFTEQFMQGTLEDQFAGINDMIYGIENIKDALHDILEVADGDEYEQSE